MYDEGNPKLFLCDNLEGSIFLTLDYITKLQLSSQYGTGTKTKYRPVEQDRKPGDKSMHPSVGCLKNN